MSWPVRRAFLPQEITMLLRKAEIAWCGFAWDNSVSWHDFDTSVPKHWEEGQSRLCKWKRGDEAVEWGTCSCGLHKDCF